MDILIWKAEIVLALVRFSSMFQDLVNKSEVLFFSFHFIIFTFTYMYTLFVPPSPPTPQTPASRHNLFHSLFLRFCWRENLRDNKKESIFANLG
jgi:hypothetical protein